MLDREISLVATCYKVIFNKGTFTIAKFSTVVNNEVEEFILKGDMIVQEFKEYKVTAEKDDSNPKYQDTYKAIQVSLNVDLSKGDVKDIRTFLESFLTKRQTDNILETLADPIKVMADNNVKELTKVSGIGVTTAERIIENFKRQEDLTEAFLFFGDYDISEKMVRKICDYFGSANVAVAKAKDNIYCLTNVKGIGFKVADRIFLSNPDNDFLDPRRIKAFTDFVFEEEFSIGNTYITPRTYGEKFRGMFENADFKVGVDYIKNSKKYVIYNHDGETRIALSRVLKLEIKCVDLLNDLINAKSTIELKNADEIISNLEKEQGWSYAPEQLEAIHQLLDNNVSMLQGMAGTGKTTCAKAFLAVITQNNYNYMACALSGKASDNLTQVTGKKASTIHSLLCYDGDKFKYNESNKLPTNVVILDELSMVNLEIFVSLLKAIPKGSKLIMLGDFGQLEAIGVSIMNPFIKSKSIPMTLLKNIHRQAEKSAIITHSIDYRRGKTPSNLDINPDGIGKTYGELEDLEYVFVESDKEISAIALDRFSKAVKEYSLSDIQIICPTKSSGAVSVAMLNKHCQLIANPASNTKAEIVFDFNKNGESDENKIKILREGDKVINVKNNRDTYSPDGDTRPIFNGNTGIIKSIDVVENSMVIDFDGIGEVQVSDSTLDSIELGYAITIHKSQGSTIKYVILALPYHYLLNSRELIYTGMTRAKDYQVIVTTKKALDRSKNTTNVEKRNVNLELLLSDKSVLDALSEQVA